MNKFLKILANLLPDSVYISLKHFYHFKEFPNLRNPKTFNEKLHWLKLHDRRPEYTTMVDKYAAKQYIADIVGEEYVIPTLGVWDKFEDIDFDALPNKFVLKTTHDCAGVIICRDKATFDFEAAKKKITAHLKQNYFYEGREWPYKDVKPRIIAEKLIELNDGGELKDIKFLCFNGKPKMLFVEKDRSKGRNGHTVDFFDVDFNHLDITVDGYPNSTQKIEKPVTFELMKELARKLSTGIPHLRVDFYEADGKAYIGELTFYHSSGYFHITPPEWSFTIGEWIELPNLKKQNSNY